MFETAKPFLLSLALGLAIGIERERAHRGDAQEFALGSRTFTLIALLGTIAAHIGNAGIASVMGLFVAALVVVVYLREHGENRGIGATTEVAAMATFGIGWLAHGEPRLAAMVGVGILAVLWLRPKIHAFAHEGLSDLEVNSALAILVTFLVNMVVKLGIVAVVGGRRLLLATAPPLVAMAAAAVAAYLAIR